MLVVTRKKHVGRVCECGGAPLLTEFTTGERWGHSRRFKIVCPDCDRETVGSTWAPDVMKIWDANLEDFTKPRKSRPD